MKKEFLAPEISICGFSAEDIITASGMTGLTAEQKVRAQLGTIEIATADWNGMTEKQ